MEFVVFIIAAVCAILGALGLVTSRHPVHAALSMVGALFSVAVLFLNLDAQFLAAVQVIVYAGAIVVLFLFVIMLLGVDQAEDLDVEPIAGQRPMAYLLGAGVLALAVFMVAVSIDGPTGAESVTGLRVDSITATTESANEVLDGNQTSGKELNPNIDQIGRVLFTKYVFAFEITALLLTIAVVGAVMLNRRPKDGLQPIPELATQKGAKG